MKPSRDFFYDEVRNGFYIPGMMKRAWGAGLAILSEVDTICKKHAIPYYAGFGTLLGAVREENFIAWDDDIDLLMFREDYERFRKFAKEELPEELEILSIEEEDSFKGMNAVVCSTEKRFLHNRLKKYCDFPYSAFVDIFPLDSVAEGKKEKERQLLLSLLFKIRGEIWEGGAKREEALKELEEVESLLSAPKEVGDSPERRVGLLIEEVYRRFNKDNEEKVANMAIYFLRGAAYPRSAFQEKTYLSFCGTKLPAPLGWESVLKAEYGDYKKRVKAGGEHDYPYFKGQEENMQKELGEEWKFQYFPSVEDLSRPPVQSFREIIFQELASLSSVQETIRTHFTEGKISLTLPLLAQSQERAVMIGNTLEEKMGENSPVIHLLTDYCEALYQTHQLFSGRVEKEEGMAKIRQLQEILSEIEEMLHRELKTEVVFLLHRAKDFASLKPLLDELQEDSSIAVKLMPIPYYDVYTDGSLSEKHYEGTDFPKEYAITEYQSYDFAKELPDCIVMNSPYDAFNPVFSVDPFFYSKNLKRFTGKLLYIPYFVTDEIDPKDLEDGKAFYNMRYYVTVPGVFHADYTLVQSEGMKEAYIEKISQLLEQERERKEEKSTAEKASFPEKAIEEGMQVMRKKILGVGSCLFGEKEGQGTKEVAEAFRKILEKEKGNRTKKRSDKER